MKLFKKILIIGLMIPLILPLHGLDEIDATLIQTNLMILEQLEKKQEANVRNQQFLSSAYVKESELVVKMLPYLLKCDTYQKRVQAMLQDELIVEVDETFTLSNQPPVNISGYYLKKEVETLKQAFDIMEMFGNVLNSLSQNPDVVYIWNYLVEEKQVEQPTLKELYQKYGYLAAQFLFMLENTQKHHQLIEDILNSTQAEAFTLLEKYYQPNVEKFKASEVKLKQEYQKLAVYKYARWNYAIKVLDTIVMEK